LLSPTWCSPRSSLRWGCFRRRDEGLATGHEGKTKGVFIVRCHGQNPEGISGHERGSLNNQKSVVRNLFEILTTAPGTKLENRQWGRPPPLALPLPPPRVRGRRKTVPLPSYSRYPTGCSINEYNSRKTVMTMNPMVVRATMMPKAVQSPEPANQPQA